MPLMTTALEQKKRHLRFYIRMLEVSRPPESGVFLRKADPRFQGFP